MFDDVLERATVRLEPVFLLVARLCFAALFLPSGIRKITGVNEFVQSLAQRGVPAPTVLGWIGAVAEFVGPILLAIGLKTRAAALLMAVFTLIATAIAHRFWEYPDAQRVAQQSNFLKNLCIFGGLLVLSARGAGPFSIDAMLGRRGRG
jgi:putative oxidoreductase